MVNHPGIDGGSGVSRVDSDGWAYARFYRSTEQRNTALPDWLHFYDHHRVHSAIGAKPPISRLTIVPGHHSWRSNTASIRALCSGYEVAA